MSRDGILASILVGVALVGLAAYAFVPRKATVSLHDDPPSYSYDVPLGFKRVHLPAPASDTVAFDNDRGDRILLYDSNLEPSLRDDCALKKKRPDVHGYRAFTIIRRCDGVVGPIPVESWLYGPDSTAHVECINMRASDQAEMVAACARVVRSIRFD